MRIQPISIGEIDVQPSIMVIVEKRQPASFGLNDGSFVIYTAPHVGTGQPGFLRHIHKLHRRVVGAETAASIRSRFLHCQRGVARASVSVLPNRKRDEPRKRLRGKIIDCDDYRDLSGRSSSESAGLTASYLQAKARIVATAPGWPWSWARLRPRASPAPVPGLVQSG